MMAHRRKRLRQVFRHTALELKKWSKTRLIRLILRLEAARVSRTGRRVVNGHLLLTVRATNRSPVTHETRPDAHGNDYRSNNPH